MSQTLSQLSKRKKMDGTTGSFLATALECFLCLTEGGNYKDLQVQALATALKDFLCLTEGGNYKDRLDRNLCHSCNQDGNMSLMKATVA